MDGILLWAAPAALLGLLAGVWFLLRPRRARRPTRGLRSRAGAAADQVQVTLADAPVMPAAAVPVPMPAAAAHAVGSVAAQREVAVEALRQARRRAAADVARLEAARQARPPLLAPVQAPLAFRPPLRVPPAVPASAAQPYTPPPSNPTAPRQAPVPPPLADRAEQPLRPLLAPTVPWPASGTPAAPLTVLVVDDSKVVRIKTSRLLEKHGYRVLLADDGLAALACLDAQPVDLLITDVEMPGLDGFGLTQRLRSQPRWTRLPVIMITSSDEKHRVDAAAVGVDVLLGKPYDEPALLAEVQRALGLAARRAGAGLVLQ